MNTHMADTVNTGFIFDMQHKLYRWSAANPEKTFADLFTRGYHHAGRAGCLETCTSGSERGMKKPDPETG